MSSNRLLYDKCAYATNLQENKNIMEYTLSTDPYARCTECRQEFGIWGGNAVSRPNKSINMVELESELMGLRYSATKCPSNKFDGQSNGKLQEKRPYKCKTEFSYMDLTGKWNHLDACQLFDVQEVPAQNMELRPSCVAPVNNKE